MHKGMGVLVMIRAKQLVQCDLITACLSHVVGCKVGPDHAESWMPWWRTLTLFWMQWRMEEGDRIQLCRCVTVRWQVERLKAGRGVRGWNSADGRWGQSSLRQWTSTFALVQTLCSSPICNQIICSQWHPSLTVDLEDISKDLLSLEDVKISAYSEPALILWFTNFENGTVIAHSESASTRPSPGNNLPSESASPPLPLVISCPTHYLWIVPVGSIKTASTLCPRIELLATPFKVPWVAKIVHNPLLFRDYTYWGLFLLSSDLKSTGAQKGWPHQISSPAARLHSCAAPASSHFFMVEPIWWCGLTHSPHFSLPAHIQNCIPLPCLTCEHALNPQGLVETLADPAMALFCLCFRFSAL